MADGFDEVYREYGRSLHAYLVRFTGDLGTADELCQETFVRYLRHRDSLRARNGTLGGWLFTVATNLARDRARKRKAGRLDHEPLSPHRDGAATAEARDLDRYVQEQVQALPEDLRAAFLLRAHHELPYARVATVLDVSERTAKERFRRAREILSHRLAPLVREDRK